MSRVALPTDTEVAAYAEPFNDTVKDKVADVVDVRPVRWVDVVQNVGSRNLREMGSEGRDLMFHYPEPFCGRTMLCESCINKNLEYLKDGCGKKALFYFKDDKNEKRRWFYKVTCLSLADAIRDGVNVRSWEIQIALGIKKHHSQANTTETPWVRTRGDREEDVFSARYVYDPELSAAEILDFANRASRDFVNKRMRALCNSYDPPVPFPVTDIRRPNRFANEPGQGFEVFRVVFS